MFFCFQLQNYTFSTNKIPQPRTNFPHVPVNYAKPAMRLGAAVASPLARCKSHHCFTVVRQLFYSFTMYVE